MARTCLRSGIALVLLTAALYQTTAQMRFGIHGGVNATSLKAETSNYSYSQRYGLALGADVESHLIRGLWFRSGIEYIEQGADITSGEKSGITLTSIQDELYREDYRYVEVPAGCKYRFLQGQVNPFVGAGITVAFLNSATKYWRLANGKYRMDDAIQVTNRLMILAYASGGVEYSFNRFASVGCEVVYNEGLTPMKKWDNVYSNNVRIACGLQVIVE